MIPIITYHKVSARDDDNDFYTVSAVQFSRQLEILQSRGLTCLRLGDLARTGVASDKKFILTFDDGTADHREVVLPILQKYKCDAAFFIPTAKLGRAGYLTNAQVKELSAAGQEIGSHSHEHERMDILPESEVRRRITQSQEILSGLTGAKPDLFVPPGGFTNALVRRVATESGIKALRTMRWGQNQKLDLMALETLPVNRYTSEAKFIRLLDSRGPSLAYAGKEALKKLLPLRFYEQLRRWRFKI